MHTQENVDSRISVCDFLSFFGVVNWEKHCSCAYNVSCYIPLFTLLSLVQYSWQLA